MMEEFTERALTNKECLDKIRAKYGDRFNIMTRKTVMMGGFLGFGMKEGVELSGYVPNTYGMNPAGVISRQGGGSGGGGRDGAASILPIDKQGTYSGLSVQALASGGNAGSAQVASRSNPQRGPDTYNELGSRSEPLIFEEEKKKILANTGNSALPTILKELQNLNEKMEAVSAAAAANVSAQEDHPNLGRLEELLALNDFSAAYQAKLLGRVREECSLSILEDFDALQDKALEWIGETISIYKEKPHVRLPRILILVGPTGVGKTTTIAKLAALFGFRDSDPLSVRMITIDGLRIGGRAQMEAYGEIMGFPVSYVDSREDLQKTIALYSEGVDLIIIDTFGKSPRDSVQLGEMKQILDGCGTQAEVHLAMMAGTTSGNLLEIMRQFEPFNYQSALITKMDETTGVGNVISALAEKGKSVSYITNGQKVPADLQRANVVYFLMNLKGFKVNRQKIEEKFPIDKAYQNQWR